ncbi:MAG: hypothetical protein UR12_C0039G0003 [candidate division TM6 bacterium GW2011_GWF2_30_66]|jgi:hypothetical protein|nr:MAG: hypothetical protein UR12_C0039G0003 [candidate division TM6 bacterium GW2011_GWF2_30_66]
MQNFITKIMSFISLDFFLLIFFWALFNVFYAQTVKALPENKSEKVVSVALKGNSSLQNQDELKKMLKEDYSLFIKELGANINDPKFLAVLKSGDHALDKVVFDHDISYKASELIPTQNEIDVEKSLKYPLAKEKPEVLVGYLTSKTGFDEKGQPFSPGGPIVTAGGKYIIDGHHRWSQLYLINPNARIKALNIRIDDPVMALKIVQLAIGSISQKIPTSLVEGKNLLSMTKADFDKWIRENIAQKAINAFGAAGMLGSSENYDSEKSKQIIIDYIWQNAQKMRKENSPIKNAQNRGLMPQTDNAKGWSDLLQEGAIDIR